MNLYELPDEGDIFVITGQNGSGKTRWLQKYSDNILKQTSLIPHKRLICLSGTVMDKFPIETKSESYAYFGRRTNNNMFSEVAPYRRLLSFMASAGTEVSELKKRNQAAQELFESISFEPKIKISFRRGRNSKEKSEIGAEDSLDILVPLDKISATEAIRKRARQVAEGLIHISGVGFEKAEGEFELMDLSSGERTYALTILALAFSVSDESTVIFDEPENSLHPKWQSQIIRDMWGLISRVSNGSQLIVATHSPLIVSGATNDKTFVLDMTSECKWRHSSAYGNSADVVLKQQFGLESPRAMSFLLAVQNCIKAMVNVHENPDAFKTVAYELFSKNVKMDDDDPLFQTVADIRREWEKIR